VRNKTSWECKCNRIVDKDSHLSVTESDRCGFPTQRVCEDVSFSYVEQAVEQVMIDRFVSVQAAGTVWKVTFAYAK
jgi:hypothetical protein